MRKCGGVSSSSWNSNSNGSVYGGSSVSVYGGSSVRVTERWCYVVVLLVPVCA